MYRLPTELEVEGQYLHIRDDGDFRVVLDCFSVLEDMELSETERILCALIIFYDLGEDDSEEEDSDNLAKLSELTPNLEEAAKKMFAFFEADMPESGRGQEYKLINWDTDSALICSAVNKVAGREVRNETYLHWWTFMGYYMAVGESSLSTVVGIRSKIVKGKSLEKWERQFRSENNQFFNWNSKSIQQREDEEWLKSVWNKDSG